MGARGGTLDCVALPAEENAADADCACAIVDIAVEWPGVVQDRISSSTVVNRRVSLPVSESGEGDRIVLRAASVEEAVPRGLGPPFGERLPGMSGCVAGKLSAE